MSWTADRLPISLPPLAGEGLDSWIEAYALRLRTTARELLNFLSLPRARPGQMVIALTDSERDTLADATGVDGDRLTGMTLHLDDGVSVMIRTRTRGLARPPAWRGTTRSRFCPRCLQHEAGRWQLSWRLPWSFACTRHAVLLRDTCPSCEMRPVPRGLLHGPTTRRACRFPLSDLPAHAVPPAGTVLAAQHHIDRILASGDPAQARQILHEIYTLAWKTLAILHAPPGPVPIPVQAVLHELPDTSTRTLRGLQSEDAHAVATGTTIALMAHDPERPMSGDVLEWITRGDRKRFTDTRPACMLHPYRNVGAALRARVLATMDDDLLPHYRLRYATATVHPRLPNLTEPDLRRRSTMLPGMLWPSWSMRLSDSSVANSQPDSTRSALSALLLLPGAPISFTYVHAACLLGLDGGKSAIQSTLAGLKHRRMAVLSTLAQLAFALDSHGSPINYPRRRALFANRADIRIDRDGYCSLCLRQGWRPASATRLRLLDLYLAAILTGSDLTTLAGGKLPSSTVSEGWNTLRFKMPPELRDFLLQQAAASLASNGISDEPILWEPPVSWATGVSWPGPDPDQVDTVLFRQLAARSASIAEVAEATGMSYENIRLYCDLTGVTFVEVVHQATSNTPCPRHGILAAAQLHDLYVNKGMSISVIAQHAQCSRSVVASALRQVGITLRPVGAHQRHFVSREWFEHEYLRCGKSIKQLATETGISRTTLTRNATQWGIPMRHPGTQARLNASGAVGGL
jgi:hypothetical protein